MSQDPLEFYQRECDQRDDELAALIGVCRMGGMARGLLFLLAGALFFAAFFNYRGMAGGWWAAFGLSVLAFLVVVVIHQAYEDARLQKQRWRDFYLQGLARIRRQWDQIENPEHWVTEDRHVEVADLFEAADQPRRSVRELERAAISDLDLEGPRSLWQLMNLARTQMGQETLSRWMLQPSRREEILARQRAVQVISENDNWRHQFILACSDSVQADSSPSNTVRWAVGPAPPRWVLAMIPVARINSGLLLLLLVLLMSGLLGPDIGLGGLLILTGVNFLISVATAGIVHNVFRQVGARTRDVVQYHDLLQMVENAPGSEPYHDALKRELQGSDQSGMDYRQGMRRLVQFSQLSNMRGGMTFLLYVVLQFGFLWDLHVLGLLESWRQKWGPRVPRWFFVLGEFEALAVLAQFRFDHRAWTFPDMIDPVGSLPAESDCWISGVEVGHPILGPDSVTNPLRVGHPGKTLLVTGSNMSGKSTYLRTLGVNLVLARMGSVVFAQQLKTPPVEIGTSMRVADSLSDGVSFFMSELQRLKQVVDHARVQKSNPDLMFVYLLDEILQGTNSRERQIAVTRVIQQLVGNEAIGALSTHDLQLPEVASLKDRLDIVHFKESFEEVDGKEKMIFDYRLREGMTPTTNALKLLALVGLDGEPDE